MKRLVATMCALAWSAAALAQAPAAGTPAIAQSAQSAQHLQHVRELLTVMKYREHLVARLQQTANAMPQAVLQAQTLRINGNTKLTQEQKKAELAIAVNDSQKNVQAGQRMLSDPKLVDDIMERVVPMYARQFTPAEIDELLVFYKSPAALKLQGLLPQLTQEVNLVIQDEVKERLASVIPKDARRK
ncbi:DUF2059 domain-containing protein [Massilia sp. Leaf139]|uniref:DUF2059 domain-containing protein n=1 Tax=Massilia sp. Leaf139 TaxID=1736272 RepID=UPI000AE7EA01|nr:DUF2059 domain-containing protein [Massilia sp. Leaf139]